MILKPNNTDGCFAQTSFAVSTTDTILDNVKPTLTLSSPIGGESWYTSIPNTITWTASDLNFGAYPIRLEYSLNGGIDYITIVDSTENDSIHTWQIPAVSSTNTRVKIKATDIFGNSETKSSPSAFFINLPDTWVLEFEPPVLPAANYEISIIPGESAPEVRASFAPSITESIGATITATYSTNLNILSGNFPNPAHLGAYWCFTFSVPNVLTSGSYFDIQMPMQPYQLWYRYNNGNWLLIPGYDKNVFSAPNYTYRVNLLDLIFTKGVGDLEFAGDTGEDEDLPVELSSFTAVTTADCFVNLTWVTESETQVSGYNVYRSETCILRDAIRLNSILVSATNTSEQHSYTILDNEVVINSHYYYWLESVELNASNTMHGPVSVNVIGNTTPIIYVSLMNSAFPNPFRTAGCTNINVSIKTGETGTVTIYNILGQTVKTFPLAAGKHTLAWDGKGSSSGIYFYKLSTPSVISNVVMIQSDHPCGTYEFGATIFYNLADEFGHTSYISVVISEDSGQTWTITPTLAFLSGDIRSGVHRGVNKAIYWDISNEYQRFYGHNYRAKVTVVDETPEAPIPSNFVFVDGGTFNNGTSDVTLSSFYLDKYELTQSAYSDVMLNNPSDFSNVINGPVEKINWFEAIEYCNRRSMKEGFTPCYSYSTDAHGNYGTNPNNWPEGWNTDFHNHTNVSCSWTANGYRLPTEMEWMFAAQGGNQPHNYTYSGSDDINSVAWYIENGYSGYTTHAVGGKLPNELGLYDMSGNVWELCWDNFVDGYYPPGPQTNPTGVLPSSSTYYPPYHVLRGGSCDTYAISCATSYRWRQRATDHFWNTCVGFRVCRTANEFVLVDGGTFNNGTSNVTVSPFYLAKSELTQSAFNNVMEYNPSGFTNVCNGPVESVSWCEAIKYCNQRSRLEGLTPCYSLYGSTDPETWQEWQQYPGEMPVYMPYDGYIECDWSANGYRLPTEAEWEFAARGGNHSYSTDYSGSNTINNVAWYTSNSGSKTHTVGTNGSNELGIYDMSGNVYEWCWDAEGDYPGGDITDPHGPIIWSDSSFRALRGGGWNSYDEYCKVGFRNFYNASTLVKETSYGFRLCRNAP